MFSQNEKINEIVKEYISLVKEKLDIDIDSVYLFGSYAKNTATDDSDIDLCFFSDGFESQKQIEIITVLLSLSRNFNQICIEPVAFPTSEIKNDNPFVKEILNTGRKIA